MTTVKNWDYYSWEEQQQRIKEGQLMDDISNYLDSCIHIQTAWGYTDLIIEKRFRKVGCKSFLTTYLLQKAGLKNIRVSKQQINLIHTNEYSYKEVTDALITIIKHPEWIDDFKEEYRENELLQRFTFKMEEEEINRYM